MAPTSRFQEQARQLVNLAGCFDYPTAELANHLEVDLTSLENLHVRLFINDLGGTKAPPYAGCHLEDRDRRQFMIDFSGVCRLHGLVPGSSYPLDHIPSMLEVLALLLDETTAAPELTPQSEPSVDPAELAELLEQYYRHWPARFAAALEQHDEVGFYAAAAREINELLINLSATQPVTPLAAPTIRPTAGQHC